MSSEQIEQMLKDEVERFRVEVLSFLAENEIGATYFGLKAARNPRLVERLKDGQSVTLQTIKKVRQFMSAYEPKGKEKAPS